MEMKGLLKTSAFVFYFEVPLELKTGIDEAKVIISLVFCISGAA